MRLDVGRVRELPGQEDARVAVGKLFRHADAAKKAALLAADVDDLRAQTLYQSHTLATHPVGHEDANLVAERAPDGCKRDARVAGGRLGYAVAGPDGPRAIRALQDVERHPILDAAGHVKVFGLGVDRARPAPEEETNLQQRRVADHVLQFSEAARRMERCDNGLIHENPHPLTRRAGSALVGFR